MVTPHSVVLRVPASAARRSTAHTPSPRSSPGGTKRSTPSSRCTWFSSPIAVGDLIVLTAFENVAFSYPDGHAIFADFNLHLKAGEHVGNAHGHGSHELKIGGGASGKW